MPRRARPAKATPLGGFLDDIDKFDPLFFRIAPKEAKKIDPQERLFLETSYHAIEDSGYTPATLAPGGKVGVFVGVMNSRYTVQPLFYSMANRISFLFDFSGPSFAVDSACSRRSPRSIGVGQPYSGHVRGRDRRLPSV